MTLLYVFLNFDQLFDVWLASRILFGKLAMAKTTTLYLNCFPLIFLVIGVLHLQHDQIR